MPNIVKTYKNFAEILQEKVKLQPHKNIIQYINEDNGFETYQYQELHEKALSIAHELIQHYDIGTKIVLLYPFSPEFIFAFWGCIYAGMIPVPASLPLKKQHKSEQSRIGNKESFSDALPNIRVYFDNVENIIKNCHPAVCLTNAKTYQYLRLHQLHHICKNIPIINAFTNKLTSLTPLDQRCSLGKIPVILTDKIKINISKRIVAREMDDILFLQYAMNNHKGIAKGNAISNKQALQMIEEFQKRFNLDDCSRLFMWMPQYHPQGLIGTTLYPIYTGFTLRFMSSAKLIADPLSWLEKIHEFRADISGAPDFIYDLCVRYYDEKRLQNIDLSAWSQIFCPDETIADETLRKFADIYARHGLNQQVLLSLNVAYSDRKASMGSKREARYAG